MPIGGLLTAPKNNTEGRGDPFGKMGGRCTGERGSKSLCVSKKALTVLEVERGNQEKGTISKRKERKVGDASHQL